MHMNKKHSSSIAFFVVVAATACYVNAQSSRIQNPAALKEKQNITRYLPPASAAPSSNVQSVGAQQRQEVKVPSILGGSRPAPAVKPPTKPDSSSRLHATPKLSTKVESLPIPKASSEFSRPPMRQAARIDNQRDSRMQPASSMHFSRICGRSKRSAL